MRKKHVIGRASDERTLIWLQLRKMGVTSVRIAEASGVRQSNVIAVTVAVRDADIKESGEDVRGAYWW